MITNRNWRFRMASFLALSAGASWGAAVPLGYSDNPCTVSVTTAFQKLNAAGDLSWPPLIQSTYTFKCQDGETYQTYAEIPLHYHSSPTMGLGLSTSTLDQADNQYAGANQARISYDAANHAYLVWGRWIGTSDRTTLSIPDLVSLSTSRPQMLCGSLIANAYPLRVSDDQIHTWSSWADTKASNIYRAKYRPGESSVKMLRKVLRPALPFNGTQDDKSPFSMYLGMRPFMQLQYNGFLGPSMRNNVMPVYFATVYLLPGVGDQNYFNRPIVVSDAFDPGNTRLADNIYNEEKFKALFSTTDVNSPRNAGYDMFFVDFSQGAGDITVNASLFLKFIEWLQTATSSPIIVGGPSMGGQIPRLAMLYSIPQNNEANGPGILGKDLAPRVKGLLSIDSPNQGASISSDLQADIYSLNKDPQVNALIGFGSLFGEKDGTLKVQWRDACSPAAFQMLYSHYESGTDSHTSASHDAFYGFLKSLGAADPAMGDPRGYRRDMPLVAIAYSNFQVPHPNLNHSTLAERGMIKISSLATRRYSAGGATGSADWQELSPGSAGTWYYSIFRRSNPSYVNAYAVTSAGRNLNWWDIKCADATYYSKNQNCWKDQITGAAVSLAEHQSAEQYQGTFIPIASALDLNGFDAMNPPTTYEGDLTRYSPFHAVFYMRQPYNGYVPFRSPGSLESKTVNDKRYQHIVFDSQLMSSIMMGLKAIEDRYQSRVIGLSPWSNGKGTLDLAGPVGWGSVPRAWVGSSAASLSVSNPGAPLFAAAAAGPRPMIKGNWSWDSYADYFMPPGYRESSYNTITSNGPETWTDVQANNDLGINIRSNLNFNDFNGDGYDDLLVTGFPKRSYFIVGQSDRNGRFTPISIANSQFSAWSAQPEVKVLTGDFNGDLKKDIVLAGGAGWTDIKVAWGNGANGFSFQNYSAPDFANLASQKGAVVMAGNFRGRQTAGLAVAAGTSLVLLDYSAGTFGSLKQTFQSTVGTFYSWIQYPKVKVLLGDFNADGTTDIALTGPWEWSSVPVAFFRTDGTFWITNAPNPTLASWAAIPGVRIGLMESNYDSKADIVLTGGTGWNTIPIATSNGDGTFAVTNQSSPTFAGWSAFAGVKEVVQPIDWH